MACEIGRIWREGTKLCDETKEGRQFFDRRRSWEVSEGFELLVVRAYAFV